MNQFEQAEMIALQAFEFMLAILRSSWNASWASPGFDPSSLAQALQTRDGLAGLLDYVCQDESLLLAFCETANLQPREPMQALDTCCRNLHRQEPCDGAR
jgi:hypothetical protein